MLSPFSARFKLMTSGLLGMFAGGKVYQKIDDQIVAYLEDMGVALEYFNRKRELDIRIQMIDGVLPKETDYRTPKGVLYRTHYDHRLLSIREGTYAQVHMDIPIPTFVPVSWCRPYVESLIEARLGALDSKETFHEVVNPTWDLKDPIYSQRMFAQHRVIDVLSVKDTFLDETTGKEIRENSTSELYDCLNITCVAWTSGGIYMRSMTRDHTHVGTVSSSKIYK